MNNCRVCPVRLVRGKTQCCAAMLETTYLGPWSFPGNLERIFASAANIYMNFTKNQFCDRPFYVSHNFIEDIFSFLMHLNNYQLHCNWYQMAIFQNIFLAKQFRIFFTYITKFRNEFLNTNTKCYLVLELTETLTIIMKDCPWPFDFNQSFKCL